MILKAIRLARITSSLMLLKTSLQNPLLLRQLEIVLNKLIQERPATHQHLNMLQDKIINIHLQGLRLEWHLFFVQHQILINPGLHPLGNTKIKVNTVKLPKVLFMQNQESCIQVEGDFFAALHFKNAIEAINVEVYPVLIKIFGQQLATLINEIIEAISNKLNQLKTKAINLNTPFITS